MDVKHALPATYSSKTVEVSLNQQNKEPLENQVTQMKEKVSKEVLENKIDGMNEIIESAQTSIRFQLHEETNTYFVQIIDSTSNEILKEIPQKKFLDMYASMAEFIGLFVDEKL